MASVLIYNTEDILKNVGNQTVSGPPYTGKKNDSLNLLKIFKVSAINLF